MVLYRVLALSVSDGFTWCLGGGGTDIGLWEYSLRIFSHNPISVRPPPRHSCKPNWNWKREYSRTFSQKNADFIENLWTSCLKSFGYKPEGQCISWLCHHTAAEKFSLLASSLAGARMVEASSQPGWTSSLPLTRSRPERSSWSCRSGRCGRRCCHEPGIWKNVATMHFFGKRSFWKHENRIDFWKIKNVG